MKASVVDLRYQMKKVLGALDRRERVDVLYHGKLKGTIVPAEEKPRMKASNHPFFGMLSVQKKTVQKVMDDLRVGRHRDI